MKPRVKTELRVGNESDATTVRDSVANDIAGKAVWRYDRALERFVTENGNHRVGCDVRFDVAADAQAVYDAIIAKWTSGGLRNRILAGSLVSLHDCRHDEPEAAWVPCSTSNYRQAVK